MNENKDDGFQEEYDVDVTSEDTEDIDLFEEDDDIGDLSDFEDEEEESKSNFFGKSKNANSEKKPLNKKNLMVLLGGIGIIRILFLLFGDLKSYLLRSHCAHCLEIDIVLLSKSISDHCNAIFSPYLAPVYLAILHNK